MTFIAKDGIAGAACSKVATHLTAATRANTRLLLLPSSGRSGNLQRSMWPMQSAMRTKVYETLQASLSLYKSGACALNIAPPPLLHLGVCNSHYCVCVIMYQSYKHQ